jgi:hypothetical protein
MESNVKELDEMLSSHDWFHSAGKDEFGRLVVYVNWMSKDILGDLVPREISGNQVVVHFASFKLATREKYTDCPTKAKELIPLSEDEESVDLVNLIKELDRLEAICGSNMLQDIFYEIHDQKNAVTNLSSKFPQVRNAMEKLYNEYGFDIIFEEMDS